MEKKHKPASAPVLEPAVTSRDGGAQFLDLSPRGFDALVARGDIQPIKIPGMRRKVYSVADLRALVGRWKNQR